VADAVLVVELALGDGVVDVDGREQQLALFSQLVEPVHAGGCFLGDTAQAGTDAGPPLRVLLQGRTQDIQEDRAFFGFVRSGGRNAVGGQGDGRMWIYEVDDTQPGVDQLTGPGSSVELQTTKTSAGVGVRATVSTVWPPARPVASFVQDVSSIDVRSTRRPATLGALRRWPPAATV